MIQVKGLGLKQTYFVEPANPGSVVMCQVEEENDLSHPVAVVNDTGLPQVNQCWLVKFPSRRRQRVSLEESEDRKEMVVDMARMQTPVQPGWTNSQPSTSESEPQCSRTQLSLPSTPRVSKVAPITDLNSGDDNEEPIRSNPSFFIGSSPIATPLPPVAEQVQAEEEASATTSNSRRRRRRKGKCVIS